MTTPRLDAEGWAVDDPVEMQKLKEQFTALTAQEAEQRRQRAEQADGNANGRSKQKPSRVPTDADLANYSPHGPAVEFDPLSILWPEGRTDLANARRFVKLHGDKVRFCHSWGKWLVWDGTRWKLDDDGAVMRLAKDVADSVWAEARQLDDDDALRFAARTAQDRSIKAFLSLAESDLAVRPDDLDQHPWLLNCPNATVDLRTGEPRQHRREDMLTKLTSAEFNPEASSFIWDKFLEAVFDVNTELIDFVQRFFGYALTGDVREHVLPVFHGSGANGKSTLIEAVLSAVGPDYSTKAAPDLLLTKRCGSHPTERADLFGKRLIAAVETEEGRRLNEPLVKELTGGDTMKARRMREDFWSFKPTWKIVLCSNHKPTVRGTDFGIWRRLKLVPFNEVFSGGKQDKTLPEKLRGEAQGILAWMVNGCLDWQKQGLGEPPTVVEATREYRVEEDIVGRFIEDRCLVMGTANVRARDLRAEFEHWTADAGQPMVSPRRFGQELVARGFERYQNNGTCYRGVGLIGNGTTEPNGIQNGV